jgi:hypothetical protein
MYVLRSLFVCAVGLVASQPLIAAPVGKDATNTSGPALVVQVQPLDELVNRVKATVKAFVPEQLYQEFERNALPNLDPKKLPGIDPKRPFGLYGNIDAGIIKGDFSKSHAVALIPVTGEKEFLALIEKAGLKAAQQRDEGLYAIDIPNSPVPVFLRFQKQYAYVSLGSSAAVDPKTALDPKDIIDSSEKAAAALHIYIERIPEEVKKWVLDSMEQMFAMVKEAALGNNVPAPLKEVVGDYFKMAARIYRMGLQDGRELAYRIDLEAKNGLVVEGLVTPKPNTKLAQSIDSVKPNQNRFASIVGSDAAAQGFLSLPLFVPEIRDILSKLIDSGAAEADRNMQQGNAPKEAREMAAEFFKALKRTVEDGSFDAAASLRGPGNDGLFTAVGAAALKDTAPVEKAFKEATKVVPPQAANLFKLDAHKIGERSVHEIAVGERLPPEVQKIFGKASIYLCFDKDAVCVSFGSAGLDLLKEALSARTGPAPMLTVEGNGKRLADLIRKTIPKQENVAFEATSWLNMIAKQEKITAFSMDIQGGEHFKVRATYGAPLMWFFVGYGRAEIRPLAPQVLPAKN